jgi:hypothetical protein
VESVEPWALGHGLLQISDAFDHYEKFYSTKDVQVLYEVKDGEKFGIYLREPEEARKLYSTSLDMSLLFMDHVPNEEKASFETMITLKCDSDWVSHAKFVCLSYGGILLFMTVQFPHLS